MIVHEILPFEDGERSKYAPRYKQKEKLNENKSMPQAFQQFLMNQLEEDQHNSPSPDLETKLCPLFKGNSYLNSFYNDGIIWVCTDKEEMRIKLKKNLKYGEKIVQQIDRWPTLLPMLGLHQGRPIYKQSVLIRGIFTEVDEREEDETGKLCDIKKSQIWIGH